MRHIILAIMLLAGSLAACTSGAASLPPSSQSASAAPSTAGPEVLPILASSEITKGRNRYLFSLTDRQNRLVSAPDVKVHLRFYDVGKDENAVVFEEDARFIWAEEGVRGLYVAYVTFPNAGRWGTRFEATFPDGQTKAVRADYDVVEAGTSPALGSKVPPVDTPTLADVGGNVAKISSDTEPLLRFYETSIADALAAGKPFVVAFATPAFCASRLCGPTLEAVKRVAADHPGLTFINVEPYRMVFRDGTFQPELSASGRPQPAPWTEAWGLPSEPFILVIAADGTVVAKFESVIADDELATAIEAL